MVFVPSLKKLLAGGFEKSEDLFALDERGRWFADAAGPDSHIAVPFPSFSTAWYETSSVLTGASRRCLYRAGPLPPPPQWPRPPPLAQWPRLPPLAQGLGCCLLGASAATAFHPGLSA